MKALKGRGVVKFTSLILVVAFSSHFLVAVFNSQTYAAQGSMDDAIENLARLAADSFVKENIGAKGRTVAVWQITNDSDTNINIEDVRDLIDIELVRSGYDVTDRSKLNLIVSEQKLGLTGSVDDSKLQQIGKIYGIDAFIYGRISRIDPGPPVVITFFVKAIDVETGKFIFAKRIKGGEVTDDREASAAEAPLPRKEEPTAESAPRSTTEAVGEDKDFAARKAKYAQLKVDYSNIIGDGRKENEVIEVILSSTYASAQTKAIARKYKEDSIWSAVWLHSSWMVIPLYWGAFFPFASSPEEGTRVGIGVGLSILGAGSIIFSVIFSPKFPPALVQSYNDDVRIALNLTEADVL